jgi:alkylhydroperoxidase family enzyme
MANSNSDQREAKILGQGPRLEPLAVDAMSDELMTIVAQMIQVNAAIDSREQETLTDLVPSESGATAADRNALMANLPEIIRTMLRHPALFAKQTDMGIQLLGKGALAPRDRELAILRIGWLCQAPYEWGEHVHVAKSVGISSEEIERITQGSDAPGWSEHDQAILRAAEELRENALISDTTWATLAKTLNDQQLIELPIVIGQYQTVAYYQNSLGLRLHEGNAGLKAR